MSNGREEELPSSPVDGGEEEAVDVIGAHSAENLHESHEEGEDKKDEVVNCIPIDISERESFQEDGKHSGQSSATATPLEMSHELVQGEERKDLHLKEWNSLINLLARIPVKAQKGLSTFDLKLTCISTISDEILVIGTNVGIVYWYNRRTDGLDRLRCEGIDAVTCISCISTVDYMVAAGNQNGLVTIFQIPRDSSEDKNDASHYERKTKKSQRFLIQDLHKGAVTALEWSKNGMKLFSGDQTGHVVLTDIDYDLVQIRSSVLLCENYEIVQLSYTRKNLLICSTFRSIIYSLENKGVSKVGKLERKITGKFGGLIVSSAWEESPKVYSVRPGGRLWVADLSGEVQHTIKFKELILSQTQPEIHVIKPIRNARQLPQDIQFTRLFRFMKDYLVTYYKDILHIIDARNTIVIGLCKQLRSVIDVAVNKDEIFILESSRNVIRIGAKPDKFSNLVYSNSSMFSPPMGSLHPNQPHFNESPSGMKNFPDIMSASISDFRFPHEPMNFLASKFKETSGKVIPKINPLLNTIKTVIEADVDIEDGQKLLETGFPFPVLTAEFGDIPIIEAYPEEPVYVPEPERFQKISNLPYEDVVVEIKPAKKGKRLKSKANSKDTASSDMASDTISVSSAYSNTSGSDNNVGGRKEGINLPSAASSSSTSGTSSEAMSASDHPILRDQLGISLSLSQSWTVGTLVPNKTVTKEELNLKEELLARHLKWPELLPENISPDVLLDEILGATGVDAFPEENNFWQVNLPTFTNNSNSTLVEPKYSTDETDTDSKTLSLENGSSFGTVIERSLPNQEGSQQVENKATSGSCSDADDEEGDKYYMDIYTRYRSKDSISSFNSVLSFGPPSGSSHVSSGLGAFGGSLNSTTNVSADINLSSNIEHSSTSTIGEHPGNSKEKSLDSDKSSSLTPTPEELDSIVESKIVTDEYWRKWRLPTSLVQISVCQKYLLGVSSKSYVYYSNLDGVGLSWKSANYMATALIVSPCGTVIWRVFKGDLYSLASPSTDNSTLENPVGGDQWNKLTQKRDVITAAVQRSFGWIVKQDGSLEFCTGHLDTNLIPYFEKVYTPWPIQEVACFGYKLWALTTDGRIVFRTGTSDLNPKGMDWLEMRWSCNEIPPACSISSGGVRSDGVPCVWFSDAGGNLYFTFEERDSKGLWVPWKVAGSGSIIPARNEPNCSKSVILTSLREQVSKSFKSLVQGSKSGLVLCSSDHSVWFTSPESTILYGNRSSITGHDWRPLRVDRGITIPSNWTNIYANSIYNGHGQLWIADSRGGIFYLPPIGGKVQQIDPPQITDDQVLSIAPAPEALWALTSTGDIHGRCDITTSDLIGTSWRQIELSNLNSIQFVNISCGSEVAWAVDNKGDVYMRIGSLRPPGIQDMSPAWNKVESTSCCRRAFTKIYVSASDSIVWALDNKKRVYARQGVFPDYPIGTGWMMVKGVDAIMLTISDNAVWALSSNNEIYKRHGITKTNFVGDYWRKIPGNASAIAVSLCDELWALSLDGYLLKHSRKIMTLKGFGNCGGESRRNLANQIVLDEEDEDWELVDNSEI